MNRLAVYWVIAAAALLLVSGCFDVVDCEQASDSYCDGNVRYICAPKDSFFGAKYLWKIETCSSAERCKESAQGAFCSLEVEKNPRCEPRGYFCSNGVHQRCTEGYVVYRSICESCESCLGGFDQPCEQPSDCASGLTCERNESRKKVCSVTCDCPPGERCAACEPFESSDDLPRYCIAGRCQEKSP